jgi:NADH-quinone oxidoreductase subunit L
MLELLWLIPTLPLAGFLILALAGSRMPRLAAGVIGVASVGLSAVATFLVAAAFLASPPEGHAYRQVLWTWFQVGGFTPQIALYLDALGLVMALVVTFVGFLIHLYSAEFMIDDRGYRRFFASMNLFVASMLTLVLADNLLLLYLGWEGVGLCSFLLIGFWYEDPANCRAARKAFLVTRVGDTAMIVGLFLLATAFGTLDIQQILKLAPGQWSVGSPLAVAAAALLLGGAVGKSAQLPLQTWLPDAMAGPTPVSALIHAATMVTAGVYLIARTNVLFSLAPVVQSAVAIIGAATLLLAGFSALVQYDIKRVLAYSTISQIGYMFLALGVGAWSAAIFHFMIHAFFKALLFLGAGAVILCLHHEHNMFRMGGLRKLLPVTFWTFLVGSASLAAVPLVTAGFYSKDWIITEARTSPLGGPWLWTAAIVGAVLTGLYTFRMVFITFFGRAKQRPTRRPGWAIHIPLIVLAVLSLVAGLLELHPPLGHFTPFSTLMQTALPSLPESHVSYRLELALMCDSMAASLVGIGAAYVLYMLVPKFVARCAETFPGNLLHRLWFSGWGFDWLYDRLLVRPFVWLARLDKDDVIDWIYTAIARIAEAFHFLFSRSQTGRLRWYAAAVTLGAVIVIAILVFR